MIAQQSDNKKEKKKLGTMKNLARMVCVATASPLEPKWSIGRFFAFGDESITPESALIPV